MKKVNALYVGNGRGDSGFVNDFIAYCKKIALSNVQIAMDFLGMSAIYTKKRAGYNVLFVDLEVLIDDIKAAEVALGKFIKKIPNMPVFILCGEHQDADSVAKNFGSFKGNLFFCETEPDLETICEKIETCLV